ncbi:major facilitator superfamily domain-containing protein 1-like isoform X3 [Hypanus sabinus]|nr:major facilitator superfamily domain-containing protein 1-like isoform X3 [Hypanus sabinus]XP_059835247.1 major facilitator superfamily domain-containing protein 1-like isoform X3 [Hypanus sabinus]XP_059835248.1 major facilitator superfamily domain-containing protein 1-like isoform X3 [Hypanus sabinus]
MTSAVALSGARTPASETENKYRNTRTRQIRLRERSRFSNMAQPAERAYYRFLLLIFNCLPGFASYFCYTIPSVLQDKFQGNITCFNSTVTNGTADCVKGLGMTPEQFNLLFATYAWINAVVVILAGFFTDKLGNCIGVILFYFIIMLGSATFALGSHFKGTSYLLPLMIIGRFLVGSTSGSFYLVQDCIFAFWFKDKELSLAFGLKVAFSRLGSVFSFLFIQSFESRFGLQWTLWAGTLLCVLGFVSAIIVGILDRSGAKQLGLDVVHQQESKNVRLKDICHLSLHYWLLVLTIMFFYNGFFPFIADVTHLFFSKFIQDKYSRYSNQEASYIAGAVFDTSLLLLPIAGILIDYIGLRGILISICAGLTVPVFALLAFTFVPPVVSMIWLGVTYSFAVASLWPSLILVVPSANLGTALGITTSVQMIGVGVCNLIVGRILGTKFSDPKIPVWRWQWMLIFMLANTICCFITSVILNIVDTRQGNTLNKTTKQLETTKEENQTASETSPLLTDRDNDN